MHNDKDVVVCTWWRGRPTMDGKTARGASSPANPALHIPEPLSHTSAVTSSSHIFTESRWSRSWWTGLFYNSPYDAARRRARTSTADRHVVIYRSTEPGAGTRPLWQAMLYVSLVGGIGCSFRRRPYMANRRPNSVGKPACENRRRRCAPVTLTALLLLLLQMLALLKQDNVQDRTRGSDEVAYSPLQITPFQVFNKYNPGLCTAQRVGLILKADLLFFFVKIS